METIHCLIMGSSEIQSVLHKSCMTMQTAGHAEEQEHCKNNYLNTIPVPSLFHATLALYSTMMQAPTPPVEPPDSQSNHQSKEPPVGSKNWWSLLDVQDFQLMKTIEAKHAQTTTPFFASRYTIRWPPFDNQHSLICFSQQKGFLGSELFGIVSKLPNIQVLIFIWWKLKQSLLI